MPYHINHHAESNIVVVDFDNLDVETELGPLNQSVWDLLDTQSQPVHVVYDITNTNMDFEEMMKAANFARSSSKTPTHHHPNIGKMVVVSKNKMIQLAAKGMDTVMFGNLKLAVAATQEEAVEIILSGR